MKNQFQILQGWTNSILQKIKKDLKSEHLQSNPCFYRTYFGNRPQNRLSLDEIFAAYEKELLKGNEELQEWVINRWVFKNGDLYDHFADMLSRINPDFDQIQTLTIEESKHILDGARDAFGAIDTYLFSVLNGVAFPETILADLARAAEEERVKISAAEKKDSQKLDQEQFQKEIARLKEKYEKKLEGVQKKYTQDTEALKKQIRALQNQLRSYEHR